MLNKLTIQIALCFVLCCTLGSLSLQGQQSAVSVIVPQSTFLQNVGDVHDRSFTIQIDDYNTSLVKLFVAYDVFETEITSNTFTFSYNGSQFYTTATSALMNVDISSLAIPSNASFEIDVIRLYVNFI